MSARTWRGAAAGLALGLALSAAAWACGERTSELAGAAPARSAMSAPLQILEDADRRASDEAVPETSPVFDGRTLRLRAARGETLGITVWQRAPGEVTLQMAARELKVTGYEVEWARVTRPSTAMYGGSRGAASYVDGLVPASRPTGSPVYFDLAVSADAPPGRHLGTLTASAATASGTAPAAATAATSATTSVAVELEVLDVLLPAVGARPLVWAYYDPRELAWQHGLPAGAQLGGFDPLELEKRCAAMFRAHGVLATPELTAELWPRRRELLAGARFVPVLLPTEDGALAEAARFWEQALAAEDQLAFAIPIDEPRQLDRKMKVRALADQVAAARRATGTSRLRLAVTDAPHAVYGDAVDIFISPYAISRQPATGAGAGALRFTYNGNPPYAGSMVLDAGNFDLRTWGWIGWRWSVPLWYVWDALYWHDRHNAKRMGLPRPGRAMSPRDSVTFDDGGDHGNRDGVLALPGPRETPCLPTLRLKALRRGLSDRLLLDAASCTPATRAVAARLALRLIPFALGDAASVGLTPPVTASAWYAARQQLLDLAEQCTRQGTGDGGARSPSPRPLAAPAGSP